MPLFLRTRLPSHLRLFSLAAALTLSPSCRTPDADRARVPSSGARPPLARTTLTVDWDITERAMKTAIGVQIYSTPQMRRTHRLAPIIAQRLAQLDLPIVRLQPWYTYPRLAVAELEPPGPEGRHWDTSEMDPIVSDLMSASPRSQWLWDWGTIPSWLLESNQPVPYPKNPDEVDWYYGSFKAKPRPGAIPEIASYFARLAAHYRNGPLQKVTEPVRYWEVLNEIELEHDLDPALYNELYDAIVPGVKEVMPNVAFGGPGLAAPLGRGDYLRRFMDPQNHRPGTPIDFISYHQYVLPLDDLPETAPAYMATLWTRSEAFLQAARGVEQLRLVLQPEAKTFVDELGIMLWSAMQQPTLKRPIPHWYWNVAASVFAFQTLGLARMGIDGVFMAELFDFPGQFAATTILDWETGAPNARFWVTQLLARHVRPGGHFVKKEVSQNTGVAGDAFVDASGQRHFIVCSRRNEPVEVALPEGRWRIDVVDGDSAEPRVIVAEGTLLLAAYGVALGVAQTP